MNITQKIFRFIVFLIFSSNMSVLIMAMHRNALIPEHYTASKTLGDKKVLLVDDNKMNLKIGSRHLKKIGVSFETAESGSLAIAKASVCLFHIILMDIQMPDINGIETSQNMRDLGKVMPIIAYTSDEETEYYNILRQYLKEKNLEKSPINDYLKKPSNLEQLEAILRKHLSKQNSEE